MTKSAPLFLALAAATAAPKDDAFVRDIRPLLDTYCSRCHGTALQTGGVNFSLFTDATSVLKDRPLWRKALEKLESGEMPPAAPLPSAEERERLVSWIGNELKHPDWSKVRNAGHVMLPRLNRIEYNNTIRDLTGIDLHPADAFPIDGPGESGFSHDRQGLFLSPLLVEKYLAAAGYVVDELSAGRRHQQPFQTKL